MISVVPRHIVESTGLRLEMVKGYIHLDVVPGAVFTGSHGPVIIPPGAVTGH